MVDVNSEVRTIPFERDIPRFPATEYELDGKLIKVPREPAPVSMPTPEDSVFNNSLIVRSADLVAKYMSPNINAKQRQTVEREAVEFCSNPENHAQFNSYVDSLLASIDDLPEDVRDESRINLYNKLILTVNKKYFPPLARSQVLAFREIQLPERLPNIIPRDVFDRVNYCLKRAYPSEFGTVIPVLKEEDVYLLKDEDFAEYSRKIGDFLIHSLVKQHNEEVKQGFSDKTVKPKDKTEFMVVPWLEGKPILFPRDRLMRYLHRGSGGEDEQLSHALVARLLIHENMHRAANTIILPGTEDDLELYQDIGSMAYYTYFYMMDHGSDELKQLIQKHIDAINAYTKGRDSFIEVCGAKISLYVVDDDGKARAIGYSGYDLNEGITEYLVVPAVAYLNDEFITRENPIGPFKDPIAFPERGNVGSLNIFNLNSIIPEFLEKLGIKSRQKALQAYTKGDIPRFYVKKFPDAEYYT